MNNGEIANRYKRKERRKVNEDSIGDNVQATMGGRRNLPPPWKTNCTSDWGGARVKRVTTRRKTTRNRGDSQTLGNGFRGP